jgi:hypothetical protein
MTKIRFRDPKLELMPNGSACLELTDAGTWESFSQFAETLVAQLGAAIMERTDGPDVRLWIIRTKGRDLSLVYSDFPNGISIEPRDMVSDALITQLFAFFEAQKSPDGL